MLRNGCDLLNRPDVEEATRIFEPHKEINVTGGSVYDYVGFGPQQSNIGRIKLLYLNLQNYFKMIMLYRAYSTRIWAFYIEYYLFIENNGEFKHLMWFLVGQKHKECFLRCSKAQKFFRHMDLGIRRILTKLIFLRKTLV